MTYKLFLDDERFPATDGFVIARSSTEAINCVINNGLPSFISFDHDLGGSDTAMVFVRWLVEFMLDNSLMFDKEFDFYVHSQNPIGKQNIEGLMSHLVRYLEA